MSHIMIQNTGELPLWGMRLLGLSNKDESKIGRFGTGLKESIALLIRMGFTPTIFSGLCKIEFSVMGDPEEIHFMLSEGKGNHGPDVWHGLGIHPNFGRHDWDDPWMILREVLCNALDESGIEGTFHDIVSYEPQGEKEVTRFFIPMSPALLTAYSTVHEKLLPLSPVKPLQIFEQSGAVMPKRGTRSLQIYHKGVWVQEAKGEGDSLFDYELTDIKLQESRKADWYFVNHQIAGLISRFSPALADRVLEKLLRADEDADDKFYETRLLADASRRSDVINSEGWKQAFRTRFGETAVICSNNVNHFEKARASGLCPIVVSRPALFDILHKAGVTSVQDLLTYEETNFDSTSLPEIDSKLKFDRIWESLKENGLTNGKDQPELKLFTPRTGGQTITFGHYRKGVCFINESCIGSDQETHTMVEEIAHHITGAGDFTAAFQEFLVQAVGKYVI